MYAEVLEVHLDQSDLVDDLSNVVIHGIDNVPSDRVVKHVGLIQEGTEEIRLLPGVAGTSQKNVDSIQGQVGGLHATSGGSSTSQPDLRIQASSNRGVRGAIQALQLQSSGTPFIRFVFGRTTCLALQQGQRIGSESCFCGPDFTARTGSCHLRRLGWRTTSTTSTSRRGRPYGSAGTRLSWHWRSPTSRPTSALVWHRLRGKNNE